MYNFMFLYFCNIKMNKTLGQLIEEEFNENTCICLLDTWHRTLYSCNCKGNFKHFYSKLGEEAKGKINLWLVETLMKHDVWEDWD